MMENSHESIAASAVAVPDGCLCPTGRMHHRTVPDSFGFRALRGQKGRHRQYVRRFLPGRSPDGCVSGRGGRLLAPLVPEPRTEGVSAADQGVNIKRADMDCLLFCYRNPIAFCLSTIRFLYSGSCHFFCNVSLRRLSASFCFCVRCFIDILNLITDNTPLYLFHFKHPILLPELHT